VAEFITITCPHCGELFDAPLDCGDEIESEFVTDCEICCRPMRVRVRLREGEVEDIFVSEQ